MLRTHLFKHQLHCLALSVRQLFCHRLPGFLSARMPTHTHAKQCKQPGKYRSSCEDATHASSWRSDFPHSTAQVTVTTMRALNDRGDYRATQPRTCSACLRAASAATCSWAVRRLRINIPRAFSHIGIHWYVQPHKNRRRRRRE